MVPYQVQWSGRARFELVLLIMLGVFTCGITWIVAALVFRDVPILIDDDGVHFWARRTLRSGEIDEVRRIQYVGRHGASHGEGLGFRFVTGLETRAKAHYFADFEQTLQAAQRVVER